MRYISPSLAQKDWRAIGIGGIIKVLGQQHVGRVAET